MVRLALSGYHLDPSRLSRKGSEPSDSLRSFSVGQGTTPGFPDLPPKNGLNSSAQAPTRNVQVHIKAR